MPRRRCRLSRHRRRRPRWLPHASGQVLRFPPLWLCTQAVEDAAGETVATRFSLAAQRCCSSQQGLETCWQATLGRTRSNT